MRILLTGSNGFLGTHVLDRLLALGEAEVRCLVRAGSARARLDEVKRRRQANGAAEVFTGSLASPEAAARALEGVEVVYHLAAAMKGAPSDMFLNTVVSSRNLLEAVVRSGRPIRTVLVSSFAVYGVAELPRGHVVDERTPLEPHPRRRDPYAQSKLRQELLFEEYRQRHGLPLVVLRPGVIYGPGGGAISSRVGLRFPGLFLHFGGDNLLPLTYVENCAEAIVLAGRSPASTGQIYNVHDDELVTCRQYLQRYRREVEPLRAISLPYPAVRLASVLVERYHHHSRGQLPAFLTPYKAAATWKGNRFDNRKLKSLGWRPAVSTEEGLARTFAYLRAQLAAA